MSVIETALYILAPPAGEFRRSALEVEAAMSKTQSSGMSSDSARRWGSWRVGCLLVVGLAVIFIGCMEIIGPLVNPLRGSNGAIERSLLEQLPLGTSRADVEAWAYANNFTFGGISFRGENKVLFRELGSYWSYDSLRTVTAEWVFGPNDRLISVEVRKYMVGI
jgi:hypothetical protein